MTKYIELEEVEKILQPHIEHKPQGEHNLGLFSGVTIALHCIKELPTIDPIATIDEMIEESRRDTDTMVLLELKSRLSPKL